MVRVHRRRRLVSTVLVSVLVATAAVGIVATSASAQEDPDGVTLEVLSSRPDMVTGGDALVAVDVAPGTSFTDVSVSVNGEDATAAFEADAQDPQRLVGLVDGLVDGTNLVEASAPGLATASLEIVNHPITGPVLSGPHQVPFICQTSAAGLGAPTDADCSAATVVTYSYRTTGGAFAPLPDPSVRPDDLAQTTTRTGETVDYVVREETGVINRAVYRFAVLAEGGEIGAGWSGHLVYTFGGGCGPGYHQGTQGSVVNHAILSRGFAVASASLNTFGNSCNDVLSAETMMMVKEHIIESLGRAPDWTMGQGGSGGAIQQILIAHNYPGLLDGIVPSATFQDSQLGDAPDCRLLNAVFNSPAGSALTADQRAAVVGYRTALGCTAWDFAFADIVRAAGGCNSAVPASLIYHPVNNPTGARCTVWDQMRNIYGVEAETGFARRTYDNTGTEYGLVALRDGVINVDQFLDINEHAGGYDNDGVRGPDRSVGNPNAIRIARDSGRLALDGHLSDVPILDVRSYTDGTLDVHTYVHSFILKQRLREAFGHADNMVMWRSSGGGNGAMNAGVLDVMADWLDAIKADASDAPLSEKVVTHKPGTAVDACWTTAGVRIDDPAEIDGTGPCTTLFPPYQTTRIAAGAPLNQAGIKCALKPVDPADYPPLSAAQLTRLEMIFPDGVCDYENSVTAGEWQGPWQVFGAPEQEVTTATVTGKVLGPGNDPVEGVIVAAYSETDTWVGTVTTTTASDGTYTLGTIPPGGYRILFRGAPGSGFVAEWYHHSATRGGADVLSLTSGDVVSGVDAKLAPGGRVRGTVTDGDGAPLVGIQVWAFLDTDAWIGQVATTTGNDGTYELEGIPHGQFRILFRAPDGSAWTWWDAESDRWSAPYVNVSWNHLVSGIDAKL